MNKIKVRFIKEYTSNEITIPISTMALVEESLIKGLTPESQNLKLENFKPKTGLEFCYVPLEYITLVTEVPYSTRLYDRSRD